MAAIYQDAYQLQICHSQVDYSLDTTGSGATRRLAGTDGALIPLERMTGETWSDVTDSVGNGHTTALGMNLQDAYAEPGTYTYLRVMSSYDGNVVYSNAIGPILKIYVPVAKSDNVEVTGILAGSPYSKEQGSPYYGKRNIIAGNVWWAYKNMIYSPGGHYEGTPIGKDGKIATQEQCDLSNGVEILYRVENKNGAGPWTTALDFPDEVNGTDTTYSPDSAHRGQRNWMIENLTAGETYRIAARRYLKKESTAPIFDAYIKGDSYGPLYLGPLVTVYDPLAEAEDDPLYIDQNSITYDNRLDQIAFDMYILKSEVDGKGTADPQDNVELITTNGSQLMWSSVRDPRVLSTQAPNSYDFEDDAVGPHADEISGVANTKVYFPDQQPNNTGTDFNTTTARSVWKVPLVLAELVQGSPNYISARRYLKLDGNVAATSKVYSPTLCLFVSARDSTVRYENLKTTSDGLGIEFDIVWDKDDKNSNGTEVSWSEYPYAWNSSTTPTTQDIPDEWDWNADMGVSESGSVSYSTSESGRKHFVIGSLSEGMSYYVRVRRYLDGDTKTYGPYYPIDEDMITLGSATPELEPSTVVLYGPDSGDYISQGDDLQLGWVTDSPTEQRSWRIIELSNPDVSIASGADDTSAYTISADNPVFFESTVINDGTEENPVYRFEPVVNEDGEAVYKQSIEVAVCVSMGGQEIYSCELDQDGNPVQGTGLALNIAAPPVISIQAESVLTAQPIALTFISDNPRVNIALRLVSNGIDLDTPAGLVSYPDGDTIWTGYFQPKTDENAEEGYEYIQWEQTETGYKADLSLPAGLDLVDMGVYTLYAMATDTLTDFSSAEVVHDITIAWAHQAVPPYDTTVVSGIPESKIVKITPDGPAEDTFDIYRHTPNGNYLIAEDVAYGTDVYDLFAPYVFDTWLDEGTTGIDQYYIVVDKTTDGDIEERDFPYFLEGHGLTFDWGDGNSYEHLELPWNVDANDVYSKNYEGRAHQDLRPQGYWNRGYLLESTLDTEVYRVNTETMEGARLAEKIRKLARHPGAVMVRTPDGMALTANVEVKGIDAKHNEGVVPVQFSIQEIEDPGLFSAYIVNNTGEETASG